VEVPPGRKRREGEIKAILTTPLHCKKGGEKKATAIKRKPARGTGPNP